MTWELKIASPLDVLASTITDATSPPLTIEAPTCTVAATGDCIEMTLNAGRPDTLAVPTRGIIRYSEDGNALFAGPAIILPTPDSKGAGPADSDGDALARISVAGGRLLVEESTCGPLLIEIGVDLAVVAYQLCLAYAHPALTVDEANFVTTGITVPNWYAPTIQLNDALDDLVRLGDDCTAWWVDATLAIHFRGCGGGIGDM